ncbi:MAG: hypothetical protein ABI554_12095 [Flavobacterium sp.]
MNLKDKIKDFENRNPMSIFYEFGYDPADVKLEIIDSFSGYFQNKKNLKKHAVSHLINNWFSFVLLQGENPESVEKVDLFVSIFNDAKKINPQETIDAYAFWLPEISQSIIRYWSLYNTQNNLKNLCIEDFAIETLNMIGVSIEGILKPFFKLILALSRIQKRKTYDLNDINLKDLGVIIDELINTSKLNDLLIINPNSVRLNQWRNIAYHHNSQIIDGEIFCSYKKNGSYFEFKVSKNDLEKTLKHILLIFKLVRISETIFCFDNLNEIQKATKRLGSRFNIREESKLLDFYSPLTAQGFKVVDLIISDEVALLKLQDMQDYPDFQKRAIHSSQFLYNLWEYANSKKLIVEYFIFNGELFLRSEIKYNEIVPKLNKKNKLSELLKSVQFTYITLKFKQNKNPFISLKVDETDRQIFYSQQGEKISTEEFIKQFTLSVFSNYLAFKSEGITKVLINIGSDGSMTRTNKKSDNYIFTVPATIKNKQLQLKIIEILDLTIELYEQGELKREIIEEAKNNNRFYLKKQMIKDHQPKIK